MHLNIIILVALVALGTAARQSRKGTNSEEKGSKHWKKELNYAKKSQLNINLDNSPKNVPYLHREEGKDESTTPKSLDPKCSGFLQQEESFGSGVESDGVLDLDIMSTGTREVKIDKSSIGATMPPCLTQSSSDPKKHSDGIDKPSKPAEDWENEHVWNLMQTKLKDIFNELTQASLTIPSKSRRSIPPKSQSIPTKSQIGASDLTVSGAAKRVESKRGSEKLAELKDCAGRSSCKLPYSRKTPTTTDGYQHSKNAMKCSVDRMAEINPERSNVESLDDRQLNVHEEESIEISALSAKLANIEEALADIRELLLDQEVDEPDLRLN